MPTIFWLWLAAAVIFLIAEIGSPTLVFACFVVGAVGAAVASTLTSSYLHQLGIFAGISIVLIPLTRPLAKKITKPSPQPTNVDAMLGRSGIVIEKIEPHADRGQVRVDGQIWRADADISIEEGDKIKVEKILGTKLIVSKLGQS
ncbi:MAG: NfeD family protein [candidate division Zixibacteria bacterium]|nr:NfeD family protein [candidate division Zixibacteria bacterium]